MRQTHAKKVHLELSYQGQENWNRFGVRPWVAGGRNKRKFYGWLV